MQIRLMEPGQPVSDFAIAGTLVTVGDVSIDCAAREGDTAVLIEIRNNNGLITEGGAGAYVAQIEIPARRYETVIVEPEGGEQGPSEAQEPVALDPDAVTVTLWPTV
ncbi:hypothetical protein [Castellaniella sp. S9]|uniref:hypothetical protein n=1 Tax=Castellaniella sp. S9 TaxID=2993652 RepID=UPI0022B477E9|nr:hypothetical protein [Castellaniella sp. S9]